MGRKATKKNNNKATTNGYLLKYCFNILVVEIVLLSKWKLIETFFTCLYEGVESK